MLVTAGLSLAQSTAPNFKIDVTEVRPSKKMAAFWPVPKEGCPKGWYVVGRAFYTGLEWQDACWNENLHSLQEDGSLIREPKKRGLKKRYEATAYSGADR